MLVSLKEQMDIAQKGSFAVPAFNVYNIETMMGVMQAAEKACAPVILQVYARSEERRVGKEGYRSCRSRWSPDH